MARALAAGLPVAWLGLAWLGLAWLGLAWLGYQNVISLNLLCEFFYLDVTK